MTIPLTVATLVLSFSWLLSVPTGIIAENRVAMDVVLMFDYDAVYQYKPMESMFYDFAAILRLRESNSRLCVVPFGHEPKPLLNWTTDPGDVRNLIENMEKLYPNPGVAAMYKSLKVARALMETSSRNDVIKVTVVLTTLRPMIAVAEFDNSLGVDDALALRKVGYFIYSLILYDFFPMVSDITNYLNKMVEPRHLLIRNRTASDYKEMVIGVLTKEIPQLMFNSVCQDGKKQRVCRYPDEYQGGCMAVFHYETKYYDSCFIHYNTKDRPDRCQLEECETECDKRWPWELSCTDVQRRKGPNPTPRLLENCPSTKPCPNAPQTTQPSRTKKPRPKPVDEETEEPEPVPRTRTPSPKAEQAESKFYIYLIISLIGVTLLVVIGLICGVCCCMKSTGKDGLTIVQRWRKRRRRSNDRRNGRDLSRRTPPRRDDQRQPSFRQQPRFPERSFSSGGGGRVPDRNGRNLGPDRDRDRRPQSGGSGGHRRH